jgi:hypothetical protein
MSLKEAKLFISDTLFSRISQKNLLSFKNIHYNDYHIEAINEIGT